MAVIAATVTDDAKVYLPQMQAGIVAYKTIYCFKVGEGGWVNLGGGDQRRSPPESNLRRLDNGLQDIDAVVDPTRAAANQRYAADRRASYTKLLVVGDFSFLSPNKLEIRCVLDTTEFNDDGFGNSPEIWEVGIFTVHPLAPVSLLMVAYGTFPMQTKTSSFPLMNIVRLVY